MACCVDLARLTHVLDGYPKYAPDNLGTFIHDSAEVAAWVAESEGRVVGHVAVHAAAGDPALPAARAVTGLTADQLLVVARLMVHPHDRRRGIGHQLLDLATSYARSRELVPVLDVAQESAPAICMYEELGWQRAGPLTLRLKEHPALHLWVYVLAPGRALRKV
jgi:GNAT superfamily N-acetyltransferase